MKITAILSFLILPFFTQAQSKVMRDLADNFPEGFVLMFYHSSLAMLNIDDDPDFARMISNIEKIKVLRIDKEEDKFTNQSLLTLKENLINEGFEELMIVKSKGYDIGVFINEDDEDIKGFFLLMDEDKKFSAIDVLGSMAVGDISQLVDKIKQAKNF